MQSKARTVDDYLAELPADRRPAIEAVRALLRRSLDPGFEEGMLYGMIGYYVPHRLYPQGYHVNPKDPLPFAALASQKQHMSLYLMGVDETTPEGVAFRAAWEATGRKLDKGKCCVRFRKIGDVAMDVLEATLKRFTVRGYIESYETRTPTRTRGSATRSQPAKKKASAAKKPKARAPSPPRRGGK